MDGSETESGKCPVVHGTGKRMTFGARGNRDWWPNQLNLKILTQNQPASSPMDPAFDYAEAFKGLDLAALKRLLERA